ncbi:MAG: cardiolipin synthase ClsB [Deltaproteobacteria bacterium]|nr:cardiolipin synthase ClsB [Deltaproteobacteria bacterium]
MSKRSIARRSLSLLRRRTIPFTEGNRVELLIDGGPYFRKLVETIAAAEHYIFLEVYILASDETGWRVARALMERARAGLEVAVCFDGYGSIALSRDFVDALTEAGVKLLPFRPPSLFHRRWPWEKRNHRKTLVVDGRVAMVGGLNISNDYAAKEDGGRGWRDTAVWVEGPAVRQLEALFRHLWRRYRGRPSLVLRRGRRAFPMDSRPGRAKVRFLGNFGRRDRAFIRRAYLQAIMTADRTIRICNAYFVPDRVFRRALIRAAKRGVSVEIIVAGATDVPIVLWASRWYYGRLLKHKIRLYEFHERILHAKTAVIDGQWVTVGSSNLDDLSAFRNLEVNAGILCPRLGAEADAQFAIDRDRSQRVDRAAWKSRSRIRRFLEWFFGRFRRIY